MNKNQPYNNAISVQNEVAKDFDTYYLTNQFFYAII